MIIKNAKVFTDDGLFVQKDIYIEKDFFSGTTSENTIINAENLYAIPGLIDLHFHGAMGHDFCDGTPEALVKICRYQAQNGVTSLSPATLTLPIDRIAEICKNAKDFLPADDESNIVGIHLEGPFLSSTNIGAQNPKYIHIPDIPSFKKIVKASGGLTKIISVSPEVEGAIEFIRSVSDDINCSVAHTTADYDLAMEAFGAGARHVTHLYNAMPPFLSRKPGVVGAAFDSPSSTVELITDGVHIHPAVVRATFQLFGEDRIVLVSDSMMATGLDDGKYSLGGLPVTVANGKATLESGTIAGSTTNLMNCLRTAVGKMNIPLAKAVKCASVNPAKALGIFDKYGSIDSGKFANLVLLDDELNIKQVILRGKAV